MRILDFGTLAENASPSSKNSMAPDPWAANSRAKLGVSPMYLLITWRDRREKLDLKFASLHLCKHGPANPGRVVKEGGRTQAARVHEITLGIE